MIGALAAAVVLGGCRPAPLYTASGGNRSQMVGEIPRDGRGEPVWHLIRPAGETRPILTLEQVQSMQMQREADDDAQAEGSRRADRPH